MDRDGWPRLHGWGLSRRAIAGLLAGVSVLSSRPGLDVLAAASDLADIAIRGFLIYQISAGGPIVGLVIAWVFIGYVVYAYTPELYLGQFGDVVEARGFRALTAIVTVYYGILFSRLMETVPDAGVFALVPAGDSLLAAMLVGLVTGVLLFSGYILGWRGERLIAEESTHFGVLEWFSVDSQQEQLRQVQTLPRPARKVVVALNESMIGSIYVLPGILLGVVLAGVNAFYPIPEGLVVAGIVASYTPASTRLTALLPGQLGSDIEFRLADEATDAIQHLKGFLLTIYCGYALLFCGVAFFTSLPLLVEIIGQVPAVGTYLGVMHSLSPAETARILALLWLYIGFVLSFLLYGLYGLFYWFQQLKRLPRYAAVWEQYWQGETGTPPTTSVRRPPGLFLPGDALLVPIVALIWLMPQPDPAAISHSLAVGYGIAWPLSVAIVAWSVHATFRGEAQSLAHEGRDILVALLLQFLTAVGLGGVALGFLPLERLPVFVLRYVLFFGGLVYLPEVRLYAAQRDGVGAFIDVIYGGFLLAIMVPAFATGETIPPAILFVVASLFLLIFVTKFLMNYSERLMTTLED